MNIQFKLNSVLRVLILIATVPLLFSCGSSSEDDGSGGGSNVNTTTAVQNASKSISDIITSNANGISGVGGDSEALIPLLALLGVTLTDSGAPGLSDDLINIMEGALDTSNQDITQTGDVITIMPSPTRICDDIAAELGFAAGSDEYNACLEVVGGIVITIVATSDTSGTLSISHSGITPFTVQYSPTQLIFTHNLANSFAVYQSILAITTPDDPVDIPDTIAGVIEMTITELGVDHGSIVIRVTETLGVTDVSDGVDFTLGPSTLLSIEADGVAETATVSSVIGAVTAMFPVEITPSQDGLGSLILAGSEVTLNVTNNGDGLDGTLSFGPLNFDIDNIDSIDFLFDPDFTIDPVTDVITLDTALDLDLEVDDSFGLYDIAGTLFVDAPAGTSFGATAADQSIFQIKSGSMTFVGTGDFPNVNDTVSVNQCFSLLTGPITCP